MFAASDSLVPFKLSSALWQATALLCKPQSEFMSKLAAILLGGIIVPSWFCAPCTEAAPPASSRVQQYLDTLPDKSSPIPDLRVTKSTYHAWIRFSGHLSYAARQADHGAYGPRHFLPILAQFVHTGDAAFAKACVQMLYDYDTWIRLEVLKTGWHSAFCQEAGYIGLYQQVLGEAGQLTAQDKQMLRDLIVFMARTIHPWSTPETFWRGPMHRAQGEGVAKYLAAVWNPDAPEAAEWKAYGDRVYKDWWAFRDFAPNDVNYLFAAVLPLTVRAYLVGDDEFFTSPAMRPVWDRLMYEVSPDGSIPPYGAHLGWNHSVGNRIAILELLSAKTKDGRYRFVAHRLMNYLLYQRLRYREHHILMGPETTEPLSLAYLFADDSIAPVEPDAGSKILYRKETIRLSSTDPKGQAKAVLGEDAELSPDKDRSQIDCLMLVTDKVKPSKIAFRSGWQRGDFFVLVDLFPRHDPLNPLGILGITRWGAALTMTISAKGHSEENRVRILPDTPAPPGRPQLPETVIESFVDSASVSFASVRVDNYDDTSAAVSRQFCFVKNQFLVVRDIVTLPADRPATISSVFNTQRVEREKSGSSALTYIDDLRAMDAGLNNPPIDLLVSFFPAAGFELNVLDRSVGNEGFAPVPMQLQYRSEKPLPPQSSAVLGMLIRPQTPADEFTAAGNLKVVKNDSDALVIVIEPQRGKAQVVVINPAGKSIDTPVVRTDAKAAYSEWDQGQLTSSWAHEGSIHLKFGGSVSEAAP